MMTTLPAYWRASLSRRSMRSAFMTWMRPVRFSLRSTMIMKSSTHDGNTDSTSKPKYTSLSALRTERAVATRANLAGAGSGRGGRAEGGGPSGAAGRRWGWLSEAIE